MGTTKAILKQVLLGLSVIALTPIFTGCVISIGSGKDHSAPPPAVVLMDSAEAATIAEIDAAARLRMDDNRTSALSQIAERASLSPSAQVHLVNVTYRTVRFDDNKASVLRKIVARADFGDATRHAIVTQLGKLSFDSNRQSLLQAINERLKAAPAL